MATLTRLYDASNDSIHQNIYSVCCNTISFTKRKHITNSYLCQLRIPSSAKITHYVYTIHHSMVSVKCFPTKQPTKQMFKYCGNIHSACSTYQASRTNKCEYVKWTHVNGKCHTVVVPVLMFCIKQQSCPV